VFRVKWTQIPVDKPLLEDKLSLNLDELGLGPPFLDPGLSVGYELRMIEKKVLAKVQAQGKVKLNCSRCLKEFDAELSADFLTEFEAAPEAADPRTGEDPDDPGFSVAYFEGDWLPLGEEIRQEMELKVPLAPVCRKACQGLCPHCGADLNDGPCNCGGPEKSGPFSGLKKLFNQSKEN
jgi:uncharacterized protein